jgi:hypothetical protein
MVRHQGKIKMQAVSELGNGEKKREGESSSISLGGLGMHAPKRKRGEEQRVRAPGPGLPPLLSLI